MEQLCIRCARRWNLINQDPECEAEFRDGVMFHRCAYCVRLNASCLPVCKSTLVELEVAWRAAPSDNDDAEEEALKAYLKAFNKEVTAA